MEQVEYQELFPNRQEVLNISSVSINSDKGSVIVQQSANDKTIVSYDREPEITRDGNRLIVENMQRGYFGLYSIPCNFRIDIPAKVSALDINVGNTQMAINGINLKKLNISGGNIQTFLKEMKGEVTISAGHCDIHYFCRQLPIGQKSIFDFSVGSLNFTAFLSNAFSSFCSMLRAPSLKIKEVFLPTKSKDESEIVVKGRCGSAEISIKKLGE